MNKDQFPMGENVNVIIGDSKTNLFLSATFRVR